MPVLHYRSIFSDDAIIAAEKGHKTFDGSLDTLKKFYSSKTSSLAIEDWKQTCYNDAMNDDFNSHF
jgi:cysteinyl-tRNA synthetase